MYNTHYFGEHGGLLVVIIIIWSILWKCYSAWIAAKNDHKKWFVALVVLNTIGILDMIYVFGVAKKKWSDVMSTFSSKSSSSPSEPPVPPQTQ